MCRNKMPGGGSGLTAGSPKSATSAEPAHPSLVPYIPCIETLPPAETFPYSQTDRQSSMSDTGIHPAAHVDPEAASHIAGTPSPPGRKHRVLGRRMAFLNCCRLDRVLSGYKGKYTCITYALNLKPLNP